MCKLRETTLETMWQAETTLEAHLLDQTHLKAVCDRKNPNLFRETVRPGSRQRRCRTRLAMALAIAGLPLARFSLAQTGGQPRGEQQFVEYCAACHGMEGTGGDKAAALAMTLGVMKRSDADLEQIIRNGTAQGMPPFAQIGDANIRDVVHYLRTLQGDVGAGVTAVTGDVHAGKDLFFGKAGCAACHMINGDGGFIASDLTDYSRTHNSDALLQAIEKPDNAVPRSSRVATAATREGRKLTGVLRYEDNFSLALQTEDGRYHLLSQNDLASLQYSGHSLMPPDYSQRLSEAQLNDIVSFLMVAGRSTNVDTTPPH